MQIKTEVRVYPSSKNGKPTTHRVKYELEFINDQLHTVRNESGYPIERESECFDFFKSKFA